MSITYPATLDNLPNPTSTDLMENATLGLDHDQQHSNANDAIEALEAKVGVNSSAVTTSHDYKLSEVTGIDKTVGKSATQTLSNKTLTTPQVNFGSDTNGDMIIRNASGVTSRLPVGISGQILNVDNLTGIPAWISNPSGSDASTTVKGVVEVATAAEINAGTATGATGASLVVTPDQLSLSNFRMSKFGGTGADGALTISSGVTNIDCVGASVVVKNYTSISITGTGSLTFTNPHTNGTHIILKSKGNVTLTSSATPMINASGMGASGGAAKTVSVDTNDQIGNNGSIGFGLIINSNSGSGGLPSTNVTTIGSTQSIRNTVQSSLLSKYPFAFVGAGGGGGTVNGSAGGTGISGAGGRGGGCLIIECLGSWNFTTTNGISVAGSAGTNASSTKSTHSASQGGAGGGAGYFIGSYNTLTANTGTVTTSGGAVGTGLILGTNSLANTGPTGGASGSADSPNVTGNVIGSVGTAGVGATGLSLISINTEF